MTRTRIVGGKITETTGGDYNIYTKENIVYSAATTITETGVENGVRYGSPEAYSNKIPSNISVKILNDTFLPLGIENVKGEIENKVIQFEIQLRSGNAENLILNVKHNDSLIYTKKIEEKISVGEKLIIDWDGFSNAKIYDSTCFTEGELIVEITGADNQAQDTFKSRYDEVKWVDIKIDNNTKKIDVLLRVDLKDGGAKGIDDADKVSKNAIALYNTQPFQTQNIPYQDLEKMALEGIDTYWSRTSTNNAKNKNGGILINGSIYEVHVKSISQEEKGMPAPAITYWTNTKLNFIQEMFGANRSRNWALSRKLFYIEGYYHEDGFNVATDDWFFIQPIRAMKDFIETAAHELGHEILKEYISFGKSITHKGSSSVMQSPNGNYSYPPNGEIDIMKYTLYTEAKPIDFYDRVVADEKDVLGLLWCSKLKIK